MKSEKSEKYQKKKPNADMYCKSRKSIQNRKMFEIVKKWKTWNSKKNERKMAIGRKMVNHCKKKVSECWYMPFPRW